MLSGFRPLAMLIVAVSLPLLALYSLVLGAVVILPLDTALRITVGAAASYGAFAFAFLGGDDRSTRKLGLVLAALSCLAVAVALGVGIGPVHGR